MKLRDTNCFLFNYTSLIYKNTFQLMKKEQSLDIDFDEFETHLLDMLLSNSNNEMLLRCELYPDESKCCLVFYEKSRIKSLIFLTIEMLLTNQKELFEEMENSMRLLQETNRNLTRQLNSIGEKLKHKENQIIEHGVFAKELEQKFMEDMQNVNKVFLYSLRQCESTLTEKVLVVSGKLVKLLGDINIVKNESNLKSESSARLLQSMENLRIENFENVSVINKLKADCTSYEKIIRDLENDVIKLSQLNDENNKKIVDLQNKVEEYRKDLENSAVVIAKKSELYNELKQDMEQANQVIRNYNKHYDIKAEEVDELKELIKCKDNLIKEQIFQNNQLFKEYHEYKVNFNSEELDKLLMEISEAKIKIETLEKEKREIAKLNGLLTKKLSSTCLFSDGKN
ncbi:hypothetical protein WA026_002773 [Henosepilachna vigintioctopunctata]